VAERCSPAALVPERRWNWGRTADGLGYWAGPAVGPGETGLLFFCGPGGQRFLQILGPEGGVASDVIFIVDGVRHAVRFPAGAGTVSTTALAPDAQVIGALLRGRAVEARNDAGYTLGVFTLTEAGPAMGAALAACR
jgi:hypothetical protein